VEQHVAPEIAVETLVARANALEGTDNTTAAVIRLER
jgi:serine/threonine protein phosphatase PrpC